MTLALQANDEDDLAIFSAHLQDAVGVVSDMVYQPTARRFAMMVNRFIWDKPVKAGFFSRPQPQRIRAGLHFEGVDAVQVQDLPQSEKDTAFELLAIHFEGSGQDEDPSGIIELAFAGGGTMRLSVECIEAWLKDIGEPWPVKSQPRHPGT